MTQPTAVTGEDTSHSPFDVVIRAQQQRIEMIDRIAPSVVCIYDANQRGGGSGVLIDPEGYGLSNFHVIAGMLRSRKGWGGLSDGNLYELEVLGIDPTGDVAMFRLTGKESFPYVELGDSDAVRVGDSVIAMGNPFVISEDYTPGVTMGIVTGTHRYQWGVGNNLIYTDCIQVDAAINPGSSGGPLFNEQGEVIGINGRISVNTRGRFNVGFGYAISSNQIKRFMPALRAGLLAKHGTLEAMVEDVQGVGVVFSRFIPNGVADRAGVLLDDKLLAIDGHLIQSRNHFASLMGTYPAHWPISIDIERLGKRKRLYTRLYEFQPKLRVPFEVNRELNLREIKRVIQSYSHAVLGKNPNIIEGQWKWTIRRRYLQSAQQEPLPQEKYLVIRNAKGPVIIQRQYEDGSLGAKIQYDNHSATKRINEEGEAFHLTIDVSMILEAQYITQHHLLLSPERLDLAEVGHVGADALLSRDIDLLNQPAGMEKLQQNEAEDITPAPSSSAILEVLNWPLGEDAQAKFSFDIDSGELIKITVLDSPSGREVVLLFTDYRDVGGVRRPGRIFVRSMADTYVDTLTDWEITP